MSSRMDRYNNSGSSTDTVVSRSEINKTLYRNLDDNKNYTNFTTDVSNTNAIDITSASLNCQTREGYHKLKGYDNFTAKPKVRNELDDFNYLYNDISKKNYDINSVLEEARKNRNEDELESKRKLKNTNYNILASINADELEEYTKQKNKKVIKPEEEKLLSLIDTITSKTLAGELDKEATVGLLSELMATSKIDVSDIINDESEDNSLSKEIVEKDLELIKEKAKEDILEKSVMNDADNDFYTRSMDLSDKDFDFDLDFREKKVPVGIKIFLVLLLVVIVAGVGYFVINMM